MSQPPSRFPRNTAPPVFNRQPLRQFNAPGLTPLPAVTPANEDLKRRTFMALGVDFAGSIVQELAESTRETEQEQRGLGSLRARQTAATLMPQIVAGDFDEQFDPNSDVPLEDQVVGLVDEIVSERTKGAPPAWAEAFSETLRPQLLSAAAQRMVTVRQGARDANVQLLQERAVQAEDAETIREAVRLAQERYARTENEAFGDVALPALRSAAEVGDEGRLRAALSALGWTIDENMDLQGGEDARFPTAARRAVDTFVAGVDQADARAARQFVEDIELRRLNGTPPEALRDRIRAGLDRGRIAPSTARRLLDGIAADVQREAEAIQDRNLETLRTEVLLGTRSPEQFRETIRERVQLPTDNPFALSAGQAQDLLSQVDQVASNDDSLARVLAREAGQEAVLTREDDSAIMRRLRQPVRPGGEPLVDANGNPTQPEALATYLSRLDRVPSDVVDWMDSAARSANVADIAAAGRLFHALQRIAPTALDKARELNPTASMRLTAIAARLDADSPPSRNADGSPNPAYIERVQAEAQRVLPVKAEALEGVSENDSLMQMTGVRRTSMIDQALPELIAEALPTKLRFRERFGPDKEITIDELPPTFRARFKEQAHKFYVGLRNSGYSPEHAKTEAAKQALTQLEPNWIFARLNDRLYVLPRHANGQAVKWTPEAEQEWREDFTRLQTQGRIDADADVDDWRPITRPQTLGILWSHVDDPMNILTDDDGNAIRWAPMTEAERAQQAAQEQQEAAEMTAGFDRARTAVQKMKLMNWVLEQRERRAAGERYDGRLELIDDQITDAHVKWALQQNAARPAGSLPWPFGNGRGFEPERLRSMRDVEAAAPPTLNIPDMQSWIRMNRLADQAERETGFDTLDQALEAATEGR